MELLVTVSGAEINIIPGIHIILDGGRVPNYNGHANLKMLPRYGRLIRYLTMMEIQI